MHRRGDFLLINVATGLSAATTTESDLSLRRWGVESMMLILDPVISLRPFLPESGDETRLEAIEVIL